MPYISKEARQQIKLEIKKALPKNVKVSIRTDYCHVYVSILQGDLEWNSERNYSQINHFHYESYGYDPKWVALFRTILKAIHTGCTPRIICEDGDYGSIPNYYVSLEVGKWDKPYQQVTKATKMKKAA